MKDYRFDVFGYLKCVYRPSGDATRSRMLEYKQAENGLHLFLPKIWKIQCEHR